MRCGRRARGRNSSREEKERLFRIDKKTIVWDRKLKETWVRMERGRGKVDERSSPSADRPTPSTSHSSFDGHSLQRWLAANRLMARTLKVSPLLTVAESPAFMSSSSCRLPFDARTPFRLFRFGPSLHSSNRLHPLHPQSIPRTPPKSCRRQMLFRPDIRGRGKPISSSFSPLTLSSSLPFAPSLPLRLKVASFVKQPLLLSS